MGKWETLSSVADLKRNLPLIASATSITDDKLMEIIKDADEVIYDDLSKYVDWDYVEDLDTVPRTIRRLSKYQACMVAIIRYWGNDTSMVGDPANAQENSVFKYFKGLYENLLKAFKDGSIRILDDENEELEDDTARTQEYKVGRII
jgi:hypothetical protein